MQLNRDLKKIFHGTSIDIIEENTISQTTVDYIRDLAISLENVNLDSSIELMTLASLNRPNGKGIKKKLEQYYNWKRKLNNQQPKIN